MRPWTLAAALALLVGGTAAAGPTWSAGWGLLTTGRYRMAVESFKKELEASPDRPGLEIGLGRALAELGRCDEAVPYLERNATRVRFDADAAWVLARCKLASDERADAVAWMEEAYLYAPERAPVAVGLALLYDLAGDGGLADAVLDTLEDEDPASHKHLLGRLRLAVQRGDVVSADELIWALRRWGKAKGLTSLDFLEGRLLLDLGDNLGAKTLLRTYLKTHRADALAVQLRAEAIRRSGEPENARDLLDSRSALTAVDRYPFALSAYARVYADLGELDLARDHARRALAATPFEEEAVASAWYVARASGDVAEAERLARQYDTIQANPLRTLDLLLPPNES